MILYSSLGILLVLLFLDIIISIIMIFNLGNREYDSYLNWIKVRKQIDRILCIGILVIPLFLVMLILLVCLLYNMFSTVIV